MTAIVFNFKEINKGLRELTGDCPMSVVQPEVESCERRVYSSRHGDVTPQPEVDSIKQYLIDVGFNQGNALRFVQLIEAGEYRNAANCLWYDVFDRIADTKEGREYWKEICNDLLQSIAGNVSNVDGVIRAINIIKNLLKLSHQSS